MKLTDFLSDVGRPVAYYPGLRRITGSTTATILLCQLIYWTGKESRGDGWIYKSSEELTEETGLSYDEQVTARKHLTQAGLIQEEYKRLEHRMYFRVEMDAINDKWGIPETGNAKMGNKETPVSSNTGLPNSLIGNTETTKENETENAPISSQKKGDLVDGFIAFSIGPGVKMAMLKTDIESAIKVKLSMNPSGKDAESFINYAAQQHKKGQEFPVFLAWWIANGGERKYWSFKRMEQMFPMAFQAASVTSSMPVEW